MLRVALLILFIFFGSAAPASEAITPSDQVRYGLKVRQQPTSDSRILAVLEPGNSALLLGSVPYYYRIKLDDGQIGYVSKHLSRRIGGVVPSITGLSIQIHLLDVGHGDATFTHCPDGQNLFADCGLTSNTKLSSVESQILCIFQEQYAHFQTPTTEHADTTNYRFLYDWLSISSSENEPFNQLCFIKPMDRQQGCSTDGVLL